MMESNVSGLLRKAKKLDPSANREEFVSLLETAIQIDPYASEPHLFLGLFYFKEQDWEKARYYLSEGLNLDCVASNKVELAEQAYVALGKTYRKLGNKEKSLLSFRALIGLYPTSTISIKLADQLYGKMNINPEWLKYYSLGCEAFINGKSDEAEQFLEKSAELNDIFPWTQYQMGLIYENKGDIEFASFTFLQAIEEERHYLFCAALANACHKLDRKDEERKCISEALALNIHYSVSLLSLIHDANEAGDTERANFLSEIIKTQIPDSVYAKQLEAMENSKLALPESGSSIIPEVQHEEIDFGSIKDSKISLSDSELLAYPEVVPSAIPVKEDEEVEENEPESAQDTQLLKDDEDIYADSKTTSSPHLVKKEISISSDSGRLKKAIKSYDSGKLKKDTLLMLDGGKMKKETPPSKERLKLQKEPIAIPENFKSERAPLPLILEKKDTKEEKYESPYLSTKYNKQSEQGTETDTLPRSSLESIMNKVDLIMTKSETASPASDKGNDSIKTIIKEQFDEFRREQKEFFAGLTEKFESTISRLSESLEKSSEIIALQKNEIAKMIASQKERERDFEKKEFLNPKMMEEKIVSEAPYCSALTGMDYPLCQETREPQTEVTEAVKPRLGEEKPIETHPVPEDSNLDEPQREEEGVTETQPFEEEPLIEDVPEPEENVPPSKTEVLKPAKTSHLTHLSGKKNKKKKRR